MSQRRDAIGIAPTGVVGPNGEVEITSFDFVTVPVPASASNITSIQPEDMRHVSPLVTDTAPPSIYDDLSWQAAPDLPVRGGLSDRERKARRKAKQQAKQSRRRNRQGK